MTAEEQPSIDAEQSVPLKLDEPKIDPENPWGDDLLSRQDIVARLTELVATQESPLTISIHGEWGTGKTFLLKRWQRALETAGYEAIYFNAWEDDYCDNPLLAIIGQLSGHFKELGLKRMARKAAKVAAPLMMEGLTAAVKVTTGLPLSLDLQRQGRKTLLDAYLEQGVAKNQLKTELAKLSKKVADRTGYPLIFIIDEMDRCRPTFAVELLERVKHIFDVPNMVFVFGINRDELANSIRYVYGDIEADIYLRRFFDVEFNLPPANSAVFAQHLMKKWGLHDYFRSLSKNADTSIHIEEFQPLVGSFPLLWQHLGMSLRDIQNCITLIALVSRRLKPRQYMCPFALGLLITLKYQNLPLFRKYIRGESHGCDVINYFDDLFSTSDGDRSLQHLRDITEMDLYAIDSGGGFSGFPVDTPLGQLQLIRDNKALTNKERLSKRAQRMDSDAAHAMLRTIESDIHSMWRRVTRAHVINLIELYADTFRR